MAQEKHETRGIRIPPMGLAGTLHVPREAYALVAFAHGSGSSRLSPRNRAVANASNARGIATLLFDLLTPAEESDRANIFDIPLLAVRLVDAVNWLDGQPSLAKLPLGLFGASTGAAAALVAAAMLANFTHVQTFGSPNIHWLKVDVDASSREVFRVAPMIVTGN